MNFKISLVLLCVFCFLVTGGFAVTYKISNPTDQVWIDAPVSFLWNEDASGLGSTDLVLVGTEILPVQCDDLDKDGKPDQWISFISLGPGDAKTYELKKNTFGFQPPSRAHTGMYKKGIEGAGWESDRIAFRMYWDERNAFDIYGKRSLCLGLKQYAKPNVNYHQETPWGMDVLKVGPSLGSGGFGIFLDGKVQKVAKAKRDYEVIADGPLRTILELKYTDWVVGERTFDLTVRISMMAGQKWATVKLWLTPGDPGPIPDFVAGVVKHEETVLIRDQEAGILGRWGLQALAPGEKPKGSHLGFGVIVPSSHIVSMEEDDYNSFVRLKGMRPPVQMEPKRTNQRYMIYKVHASWIHEPGGADSAESYEAMLRNLAHLTPKVEKIED